MILNHILAAAMLYAVGLAFALIMFGVLFGRRWALVIALASIWMLTVPALAIWLYAGMGADIRGWVRNGR